MFNPIPELNVSVSPGKARMLEAGWVMRASGAGVVASLVKLGAACGKMYIKELELS